MDISYVSLFFITLLCSFNIWLALKINTDALECTEEPQKYNNYSFALMVISGIIPSLILLSRFLKPTGPVITGLVSISSMYGVYLYNELIADCEKDEDKERLKMIAGILFGVFVLSVIIYNRMVMQAKEILN